MGLGGVETFKLRKPSISFGEAWVVANAKSHIRGQDATAHGLLTK